MHVYDRRIEPGANDSLALVAEMLGDDARLVLDVGTGTGALGQYLTARGRIVDGVNYSAEEAELARPHYRDLVLADLEEAALSELLVGRKYDRIVFADVLEHLRDPVRTLADAVSLLEPSGKIIVSVPNIGHCGVVAELVAGRFPYADEGILDRTHLRFFTRESLMELLQTAGLRPVAMRTVERMPEETEFRARRVDALSPGLVGGMLANPDALTYQFVVMAGRESEGGEYVDDTRRSPPELTFVAQVYWATAEGGFAETRTRAARGRIGAVGQRLRFELPGGTDLVGLRFDPADRTGVLLIRAVRWVDSEGVTKRAWTGEASEIRETGVTFVSPLAPPETGALVGMVTDDPGLELLQFTGRVEDGDAIECDLDWPMSPDVFALKERFDEWLISRESALRNEIRAMEHRLADSEAARVRAAAEHADAEAVLGSLYASELRSLRGALLAAHGVLEAQSARIVALERTGAEVERMVKQTARLSAELAELRRAPRAVTWLANRPWARRLLRTADRK